MESSGRSDIARAASCSRGSGEASAAAAAAAAVTETTSAPTSGEHSCGKKELVWLRFFKWNRGENPCESKQEPEEIDGLDWDDDKLAKEIDGCLRRLKDTPFVYYGDAIDDESFPFLDEQQLRVLNRRLALCRIRAYEEKYQDMDDEALSALFPPQDLDANEYYLDHELGFEWYFDDVYCQYAHFQDYQRLVLRNNGEYEKWEYYRRTCSTLEGDQEYVQFWEELSSKTELIEWYITRTTRELKTDRLFYYHTLKIAAVHPNVYKALINSGCIEFRRSLEIDFILSRPYADFLIEMWKLLTGEKLSSTLLS